MYDEPTSVEHERMAADQKSQQDQEELLRRVSCLAILIWGIRRNR